MPKLKKETLKLKTKTLTNLYKKHKGSRCKMADELGISRQALNARLHNKIGIKAQQNIEDEINAEAKKLGISIKWYLQKLKNGVDNATKITGYINNKVNGVDKVSDEFLDTPDWAVQHKYLVTLGEILKWIKQQNTDVNIKQQVVIGDLSEYIKQRENDRIQSA